MTELKNELTWSFSRHNTLQECKRKYFYSYYLSWDGWNHQSPEDKKLAYRLKKLTNFYMWKGNLVHDAVQGILETIKVGKQPSSKAVKEELFARIDKEWKQSKSRAFVENPKRAVCLEEHYYGGPDALKENIPDKLKIDCFDQVKNFLKSDMFTRSMEVIDDWISIEKLDSVEIGDTKCWVKIDFLYKSMKGFTCIVDWKTGQVREAYKEQLGMYAIYAQDVLDEPIKKVVGFDVFLAQGPDKFLQHRFNGKLIKSARVLVSSSIEEMKKLLKNVNENEPKSIKNFPRVNNTPTGVCKRCCYRELCHGVEV